MRRPVALLAPRKLSAQIQLANRSLRWVLFHCQTLGIGPLFSGPAKLHYSTFFVHVNLFVENFFKFFIFFPARRPAQIVPVSRKGSSRCAAEPRVT